jgi:N-acetylneuraminic acid mutarotase
VEREIAVLANDTIYLAGGLDSAGQSASGVFTLNPATGALASVGSLPHAFHDAAAAVLGGRLFVFGGGAGEGSDVVQAFDLQSHRARLTGRLPKVLSDLSSASVGSTVYLVGGYDGFSPQSAIYATTDGVRFRVAARLPQGLRYAAAASVGPDVVVAGGMTGSGPVSSVYLFDSATGRVSLLGRMPTSLGHAMAFVIGGTVYVAGGQDRQGRAVRQVVAVDVVARTVTRLAPLPVPLSDSASVSDSRVAWLIGGWRGHAVAQVLTARPE